MSRFWSNYEDDLREEEDEGREDDTMRLLLWNKNRKIATTWYEWLRDRGVPAALVKTTKGYEFSVFRGGKAWQRERDDRKDIYLVDVPVDKCDLSVEVIESCHGYDWRARHGRKDDGN